MARFALFHRTLNRDHQLDIQAYDWSGDAGKAYMQAERGDIAKAHSMGMIKLVAFVEVDSVNDVFPKTNHITHSWTENDGITMVAYPDQTRSTSTGDIVINMDTGKCEICAMIGWDTIEGPTVDKLIEFLHID